MFALAAGTPRGQNSEGRIESERPVNQEGDQAKHHPDDDEQAECRQRELRRRSANADGPGDRALADWSKSSLHPRVDCRSVGLRIDNEEDLVGPGEPAAVVERVGFAEFRSRSQDG
jgi:hypothetical protein